MSASLENATNNKRDALAYQNVTPDFLTHYTLVQMNHGHRQASAHSKFKKKTE